MLSQECFMPSVCVGVDVLLEGLEEKFCSNHSDLAEQQLPLFLSLVPLWNTLSSNYYSLFVSEVPLWIRLGDKRFYHLLEWKKRALCHWILCPITTPPLIIPPENNWFGAGQSENHSFDLWFLNVWRMKMYLQVTKWRLGIISKLAHYGA